VTDDPYDLERFVAAQNEGATYDRAVGELRRGRRRRPISATTSWERGCSNARSV
jgi:uncharacterized protein (DUF1810 family)